MRPERRAGTIRFVILVLHVAALLGGCGFAWSQWTDLAGQQAAVDQARDVVERLDARLKAMGETPGGLSAQLAADPFLQAASPTVAGAGLQARVVSMIREAGGAVTSSQVDLSGAASTPPAILLTVSCQLDQTALQRLLYALEAGTPALFIDQLSVESAASEGSLATPGGAGPLRIAMTVSAYWRGDGKS